MDGAGALGLARIGARPAVHAASDRTRAATADRDGAGSSGTAASASASDAGSRPATSRSSQAGIHQFQRPSRRIVAGTSSARTTVASRATAIAIPIPSALISTMSANANEAATTTTISAAEVTIRPLRSSPRGDGLGVVAGPVPDLLHPRQQEDLVVHRQPEQDAEQDHRLGRLDEPERLEAEDADRLPSWKIQTSAPKLATIDSVFMTSALAGSTTERSRTNSTR